jgi:hypothetical protein
MNRRSLALTFVALTTVFMAGCTMCQCPDDSYGYFGGLYQRTDPTNGRAGSIVTTNGEMAVEEGEVIDDQGAIIDDDGTYYENGD